MIHIHSPQPTERKKKRMRCPTCGKRRTFSCAFTPWYGWLETCLGCGDSWQDGERMPRPFARGWREKAIQRARTSENPQ